MHEVTAKLMEAGLLNKALTSAASLGDIGGCRELLRRGADVNWIAEREVSALHWAAQYSNVELLRVLIAAGADVNLQDSAGTRPLTLAIACGANIDTVRTLLESGAEPNVATKAWSTPLCRALANNDLETMRVLLEHGARVAYVSEGAPANTTNALQQAVIWGKVEAVRLLGAACDEDLDHVTCNGHTLLDLANGRADMTSVIHALKTAAAVRNAMGVVPDSESPRPRSAIDRGPM